MTQKEKLELLAEHTRRLYTVRQFIAKQNGSWPSESALRAIILDAAWGKNNFQAAFKRVKRRVLIDSDEFWAAVDSMQEGSKHG